MTRVAPVGAGGSEPHPGGGVHALATGAGKDATLALHRARSEGLEVAYALNIFEGSTRRIRFHGTRVELVREHVRELGLEPVEGHTRPEDFEPVFLQCLDELRELGVAGLVFGNIHLADVRAWYEERVRAAALRHVEPLWGGRPSELVREFLELGYRATVVSVDLARGDPAWVGRELDAALLEAVEASGADPCGEAGEYHTFVWDGPGFRRPVRAGRGEVAEVDGHRFLDLLPRG